jgi:phosphohistidine phosphatase
MNEAETRRTLLLLRHAKASHSPGLQDIERPLTERGHRDAHAVGEQLVTWGIEPDLVLCSPAVRTRETWDGVTAAGVRAGRVEFSEPLYDAYWSDLVALVRATSDQETTVLVVGHGPAIPDAARLLATDGEVGEDGEADTDHPVAPAVGPARSRLVQFYPTSGLTRFTVEVPWVDLAPGTARLDEFVVPRA